MPLGSVSFLDRGGNSILQQILGGQNASLTGALSNAVQLTRDANSNQLAQENAFLGERRFDRTFREGQFVDRRNFDRTVFTQDRTFGEGVRQFNVNDRARGQELALRAELGRGQLDVARGGLAIDKEKLGLYRSEAEQRIELGKLGLEQTRDKVAERDLLMQQAELLNNPEEFRKGFADLTPEQLAAEKARLSRDVQRGLFALDEPAVAGMVGDQIPTYGVLPQRTPADEAAVPLVRESETDFASGDFFGGMTKLANAASILPPNSPQLAEIKVRQAEGAAMMEAAGVTSDSAKNAEKAREVFLETHELAFGKKVTEFDAVKAQIRAANTAEDFASEELDDLSKIGFGGDKPADMKRRADRAAARRQLYFLVKGSADTDLDKAQSKGDKFFRFFRDFATE